MVKDQSSQSKYLQHSIQIMTLLPQILPSLGFWGPVHLGLSSYLTGPSFSATEWVTLILLTSKY